MEIEKLAHALNASAGLETARMPKYLRLSHGIMEAIQSPGSQAAVSDAAPKDDAAAAQGLGEAMGSAASMIGALSAAPLYSWLGAGPAFLIGAVTMAVLLTLSWLLDPPSTSRQQINKTRRASE